MKLSRGDVLRVRAIDPLYNFHDGLADVTAIDGEDVQVHFRTRHCTRWFRVGAASMTERDLEHFRFAWKKV